MKNTPKIEKNNSKEPPTLDKVSLKIKRKKSTEQLTTFLKKLSFLKIQNGGQNVTATRIESLDLEKKPYSYWKTTFTPDEIQLEWSTPPTQHSLQRRIEVTKNVFELLTLVDQAYPCTPADLRPLVIETIEQAFNKANKTQAELEHENDAQNQKIRRLLNEKEEFEKSLTRLNTHITELANENDKTKAELSRFTKITDLTLKTQIMERIAINPDLDIRAFSAQIDLPLPRIENALDELVKQGYLQPLK